MTDPLVAKAYVSWGLWVADCPRPDCRGAEHHGHAPITGMVGGLTQSGFRCARCELVCPAAWPDNAAEIWSVLSARPIVETRSWLLGETLEDLVIENAQHGLGPLLEGRGGLLITDGKFAGQQLVAPASSFAIGA